jgi:hypothetical protein
MSTGFWFVYLAGVATPILLWLLYTLCNRPRRRNW